MGKKITDLHYDCLEEIFKYLNKDELLNMALSDKHFISICSNVFFKIYKTKDMVFSAYGGPRRIERQINELRYFGKSISMLDIDCRLKDFKIILDTFTKHCKDAAREIIFHDGQPIDILSEPFLKLEKLTFSNCVINFSNKIFNSVNLPNLRSLTLKGSKSSIVNDTFIKQSFLNLKEFGAENVNLNLRSLMIFTLLNPQLESLTLITENMTNTFIADIAETLTNLKSLTSDLTKVVQVASSGYNTKETLLRELKSLKLLMCHYDQYACLFARLPISSNRFVQQIEQLELHFNGSKVEDQFYQFIARCQNLKYLKVFDCDLFHLDNLRNMQQLRDIEIESSDTGMHENVMFTMISIAFRGSVDILETSPYLHQICLKYSSKAVNFFQFKDGERKIKENVSHLRARIGANWEVFGELNCDEEQFMYGNYGEACFYMYITKK